MLHKLAIAILCLLVTTCSVSYSQSLDSATNKILNFPSRLLSRITGKTSAINQQLTDQAEKYLQKLARREASLKRKISRFDSVGAARLFNPAVQQQYAAMLQSIKKDSTNCPGTLRGQYLANLDSVKVGLGFLQQSPQLLGATPNPAALISAASLAATQLQTKVQSTDQVQDFIRQRKAVLQDYLSHLTQLPSGLSKEYQGLNQDLYYYSQQVQQYKDLINDPDKMEKKLLSLLDQLPAFQKFMANNSQLATLFGAPGKSGTAQALTGLQTRDQLQQIVKGQLSAGGPNAGSALQGNLLSAQSQLSQLKDRLTKYGAGGSDVDNPDFRPNNEKTRTFLHRIEYGFNLQTIRNYYFPVTTDFGLSLGYKLNDHNSFGVGAAYKIGWGSDIQHIAISSQGAALRSFLDIRVKKSWYASGGYEYNYTAAYAGLPPSPFTKTSTASTGWTTSGLLGISKIVSLQTKFLKKTKLQLLWDFLSYQQVPRTQPILFRVGYSLN